MDLRAFFILFFLFVSLPSWGVQQEPVTPVVDSAINEAGGRATVAPARKYPLRNVYLDRMNSLPGMQVRENGSPTVSIRGSQSSSRVLSLIDDMPAYFGDGAGLYSFLVPMETLSGVRILKSPGTGVWGHGSIAGASAFLLKEYSKPVVRGQAGSFNTQSIFGATPLPLGKSQLTAFYKRLDGHRPRSDKDIVRSTLRVSGKVEKLEAKVTSVAARTLGSTPAAKDGSTSPQALNNVGVLSGLNLGYPLSDDFKIASRTYYRDIKLDYTSGYTKASSFTQGGSLRYQTNEINVEGFADFSRDRLESPNLSSTVAVQEVTDGGLITSLALDENSTLQAGGHVSTSGGGLLPSVGMTSLVQRNWKVYASYAEGYQPPSLYHKYTNTATIIGNPQLKPERSYQIDLGMERSLEEWTHRLDVFQRETRDMIITQTTGSQISYANVNRALAYGGEYQALWTSQPWEMDFQLGYLRNRSIEPDAPITLSPQFQSSLEIRWTKERTNIGLRETYWTSFFNSSTNEHAGWATTDFDVNYQLSDNLKARLEWDNIFDTQRELTNLFPEPGSSVYVSLEGTL